MAKDIQLPQHRNPIRTGIEQSHSFIALMGNLTGPKHAGNLTTTMVKAVRDPPIVFPSYKEMGLHPYVLPTLKIITNSPSVKSNHVKITCEVNTSRVMDLKLPP